MCCWSTPPRYWPGQERKLDGRQEAHLIAFVQRRARRSHALDTSDKVVELEFAEPISLETVRQINQALEEERVVYR